MFLEAFDAEFVCRCLFHVKGRLQFAGNQELGVWMLWVLENLVCQAVFNQAAVFHDQSEVGQVIDHSQVMGDDNHGKTHFVLQGLDEIKNSGLHGNIESCCRFIKQQQAGELDSALAIWMRCC